MKSFIFISILLLSASCDSRFEGTVTATPNPPEITLTNNTNKPVHYVLIETETSYLVDLADPCDNFQPNLPAHSELKMPYSQIMGFNEDATSAWFYWTDCQGNSNAETINLF